DLRAREIDVPVLVLSMHDESLYAERALRAGAKGYITKHEASDEVMTAIRRVLGGEIYLSAAMTARVLSGVVNCGIENKGASVDRLTDRELEVFELMGRGLTSREIAEKLHLGLSTVETYRA